MRAGGSCGARTNTPRPPTIASAAGSVKPIRQPKFWISHPAITGPNATPKTLKPRYRLTTFDCSSGRNTASASASDNGPRAALAMPSRPRAATSTPVDWATAAPMDATSAIAAKVPPQSHALAGVTPRAGFSIARSTMSTWALAYPPGRRSRAHRIRLARPTHACAQPDASHKLDQTPPNNPLWVVRIVRCLRSERMFLDAPCGARGDPFLAELMLLTPEDIGKAYAINWAKIDLSQIIDKWNRSMAR